MTPPWRDPVDGKLWPKWKRADPNNSWSFPWWQWLILAAVGFALLWIRT
jgi:hypothetical protein